MAFELSPLPSAADALAPYMSAQHVQIHHGKHHAKYVETLNTLVEGKPEANQSLEEIIVNSVGKDDKAKIFNNAAQIWNHDFFWLSMKPQGGGSIPTALEQRIIADFGSVDDFKAKFVETGVAQFGSGWVWLVVDSSGKLALEKTGNADLPLAHGKHALFTCDVWEHAYYLDFQNRRPDFLKNFIDHLVNWEFAAERLTQAK